jgi:polyhydroxyalkanoate synthesis regulator phasin
VVDELVVAARALEAEPGFPTAYAERVRAAVRRLDPLPAGPLSVRQALALVTQEARIDVDAPLRTRRPGARVAKLAVKRVMAWYLQYVASQVSDLGQAMVHLGEAVSARLDGVQADLDALRSSAAGDVEELRRRVAALEAGFGKATPGSGSGPSRP